jgi:outer membrane protein assembly factor BamD (BamD/ComL family)
MTNTKARTGSNKSNVAQGPTTTSLAELRLIGDASRALREGRTDEARTVLSEHEKRYSNTALSQERAGLDLIARCSDGGSDETRRAAEAWLRSSPKSPLAGTIRRECLK